MENRHMLSEQDVDDLLQLSDGVVQERLRKYMFFLSISDGLTYIRNHSENKVPYTINVFEKYDSDEPTTSWAMAEILKFHEGGKYPLLNLFIENFLVPIGFNLTWIDNPNITEEKDRIDVCVRDNKYAIIFENKVKGAGFQPNQIARYIHKLNKMPGKQYGKDNIFIVLMPACHDNGYVQNMSRSVWRLPEDHRKAKYEQRCVTEHGLCWCDYNQSDWEKEWDIDFCKSCIKTFKQDYGQHTIALQHELSEWLINDCLKFVPAKETILKSFILQFADFLNLQYGTRENQKLKCEMEKYLREKLFDKNKSNIDNWNVINDKLREIKKLEKEVGLLLESISRDVIDDWHQDLLPAWKCYGLKHEERKSLGICVQGVWIGCWNGGGEDNHEQYWGFYSEKEFTSKQHKMIKDILDETNINDYVQEKNNRWYWNYTCNGAERCNDFYNAAIELGYLEKQD